MASLLRAAVVLSLAATALGHAGGHTEEEVRAELALRDAVTAHSKRSLDRCSDSPAARALRDRALARRVSTAHALREARGLSNEHVSYLAARDSASLTKWAAVSHNETSTLGYTLSTPASTIFTSNTTCALVPETVIGPYYVSGELLRSDLVDGQSGVPLHLDVQFVDVTTCEPISALLIDIWHCNATGVYSGVAAQGQGGLATTHGRGVQRSDADGVVQFDTVFPGHYTGRATHIHVLATANATEYANETFTGGRAQHVGQMYFDQALISAVEATSPYTTNSQSLTTNAQDTLAPDEATAAYDPFVQYVMLGASVSDGLLGWITIALNSSANYTSSVTPAAHYLEGGGVAVEGGGGGAPGGPGGPGGAGGPPGAPGNGTMTAAPTTATESVASNGTAATTSVSRAAAARAAAPWRLW